MFVISVAKEQIELVKLFIFYSNFFTANGSPVLLLVFSAGPVNISFVDRDPRVEAIIQCFFPAQATGEALFNTVTMATKDASPAGRLPYTWYDTADQVKNYSSLFLVSILTYSIRHHF